MTVSQKYSRPPYSKWTGSAATQFPYALHFNKASGGSAHVGALNFIVELGQQISAASGPHKTILTLSYRSCAGFHIGVA